MCYTRKLHIILLLLLYTYIAPVAYNIVSEKTDFPTNVNIIYLYNVCVCFESRERENIIQCI